MPLIRTLSSVFFCCLVFSRSASLAGEPQPGRWLSVGLAKIDITPELPIQLSGYASRKMEATEVRARLYARAIAFGADNEAPVVLVAVETIGFTEELSSAVAAALRQTHGIERERLALCATHIHTGPAVIGPLMAQFQGGLGPDAEMRIERYTAALKVRLQEVVTEALANRLTGRLEWGQGEVGFATQRRKIVDGKWVGFGAITGGVTDHDLPVMRVVGEDGRTRAVLLSYACHCTTLTGDHNFVHSDWAGDAAARIEAKHDGAVALIVIGCGADADPQPRGQFDHVAQHGAAVVEEVERVLAGPLQSLGPVSEARYREIELPLAHTMTRDNLVARINAEPRSEYTARQWIRRLDAGEIIPTSVTYPLQTWTFGDELAMVFLSGEVVADYSLRLKSELDGARLWVNAYSNSVPCYIPSRRMFAEGGYEPEHSIHYYGLPSPLSPDVEDRVISAAKALVPAAFELERSARHQR